MNYSNKQEYEKSQNKKIPQSKIRKGTKKFYKELEGKDGLSSKDLQKLSKELCKDFDLKPIPVFLSGKEKSFGKGKQLGNIDALCSRIQVFKYTAKTNKLRSNKSILGTFLHEFVHYIDLAYFKFSKSPHTKGFFKRISQLEESLKSV